MRSILFFLLHSFSLSFSSDCHLCQLEGFYRPENGYECFYVNPFVTRCSCPDKQTTINKPCRASSLLFSSPNLFSSLFEGICDRTNICGPSSDFCSEQSTLSTYVPSPSPPNSTFFACFCPSGFFLIGQPCPEITTTTTTTSTVTTSTTTSTSTPLPTTTTTTTPLPVVTECSPPAKSVGIRVEVEVVLSVMLVFLYFRV